MEIAGYLAAVLIGITLGLFGAGGSILTLPVLYYLFHVDAELGTAYSLFIVGATALAGTVPNMFRKTIHYRAALIFGLPSIAAVYVTRAYLLRAIPDPVLQVNSFILSKDIALLSFFALLMIFAAISMIRSNGKHPPDEDKIKKYNYPMIFLEGVVVGTITGLVGAGGGFLIIPALVLFAGLPMRLAVGTSLLIIAVKSLLGFIGDIQADQPIEWGFLLFFTALTIVGILAGTYFGKFVSAAKLRSSFGWFVLIMGLIILMEELFFQF